MALHFYLNLAMVKIKEQEFNLLFIKIKRGIEVVLGMIGKRLLDL